VPTVTIGRDELGLPDWVIGMPVSGVIVSATQTPGLVFEESRISSRAVAGSTVTQSRPIEDTWSWQLWVVGSTPAQLVARRRTLFQAVTQLDWVWVYTSEHGVTYEVAVTGRATCSPWSGGPVSEKWLRAPHSESYTITGLGLWRVP
jgi:hypothetical protein